MKRCYVTVGSMKERFVFVLLVVIIFESQSCHGFTRTSHPRTVMTRTASNDKSPFLLRTLHQPLLSRLSPNGMEESNVMDTTSPLATTTTTLATISGTTNAGTNGSSTGSGSNTILTTFSRDLIALSDLRPPVPAADFSAPTAIISAGSSYTRLWTAGTWDRHRVPPHIRYWKHVRTWSQSTSAHQILPAVGLSVLYSLCMASVLRHGKLGSFYIGTSLIKGSSVAMVALSSPLALLLTLRANASLGRLNEARQLWGRLVLRGRNLAALLRIYILPFYPTEAILAARYLCVLGWSMKAFVRDESNGTQRQVLKIMLGSQEAQWLLSQDSIPPPLAILLRLRQIIADVSMKNNGNPNFFVPHTSMENAIDDLDSILGGCQRLLTSPIPPTYSRHLSRIMVMYLCVLPFAFVAGGTPSLGIAVASALVSYVIIGIDEIGMEMENPFPLLPLQQLASNFQNVVGQQLLV